MSKPGSSSSDPVPGAGVGPVSELVDKGYEKVMTVAQTVMPAAKEAVPAAPATKTTTDAKKEEGPVDTEYEWAKDSKRTTAETDKLKAIYEWAAPKSTEAMLKEAGCSIVGTVHDEWVQRVMKNRGWKKDKVLIIGPPEDSVCRVAMFVVQRGLHKEKVNMYPIDLLQDLDTDWFRRLCALKSDSIKVPLMIIDDFIVQNSIPIIKVLMIRFPPKLENMPQKATVVRRIQMMKEAENIKEKYVDDLVKYFGFCAMLKKDKSFEYSGGIQDPSKRSWVQEKLKPIHEVLVDYDQILAHSKYLDGDQECSVDAAAAATIGSMYYICHLPVPTMYPNVWRYYNDLKNEYMSRPDWLDISKTGCGFFSVYEQYSSLMEIFNLRRRKFASLRDFNDSMTNCYPCNSCDNEEDDSCRGNCGNPTTCADLNWCYFCQPANPSDVDLSKLSCPRCYQCCCLGPACKDENFCVCNHQSVCGSSIGTALGVALNMPCLLGYMTYPWCGIPWIWGTTITTPWGWGLGLLGCTCLCSVSCGYHSRYPSSSEVLTNDVYWTGGPWAAPEQQRMKKD